MAPHLPQVLEGCNEEHEPCSTAHRHWLMREQRVGYVHEQLLKWKVINRNEIQL